jgi:LysM repeat protein
VSDRLLKGSKPEPGQSLTSRNGAYTLTLQDDGNLVLAAGEGPAWSSKTDTTEPPPPAPEAEAATPDVAPVAEPAPPPPPAPRTYTVVSGDTLWAISERFTVTAASTR